MTQDKAKILEQEIKDRLQANYPVDEELYRRLFDMLASIVMGDEEAGDAFDALRHDVQAAYLYEDAWERDGFDSGACWAAMAVMQTCTSYTEKQEFWRKCISKVKKHHKLFMVLETRPGVNQKELAEALDCGTSNVCQVLGRLEKYRLFVEDIDGRSKRYSLSNRGKRALAEARAEEVSLRDAWNIYIDDSMIGRGYQSLVPVVSRVNSLTTADNSDDAAVGRTMKIKKDKRLTSDLYTNTCVC